MYGTGKKREDFNHEFGVDPNVYQLLNTHAQRSVIKSIDLKKSRQLERLTNKSFQATPGDPDQLKSFIGKTTSATNSTKVSTYRSTQFESSRREFSNLVTSLVQNPFKETATCNNHDKAMYQKNAFRVDKDFRRMKSRQPRVRYNASSLA